MTPPSTLSGPDLLREFEKLCRAEVSARVDWGRGCSRFDRDRLREMREELVRRLEGKE